MKRRIFTLILAMVLLSTTVFPVFANANTAPQPILFTGNFSDDVIKDTAVALIPSAAGSQNGCIVEASWQGVPYNFVYGTNAFATTKEIYDAKGSGPLQIILPAGTYGNDITVYGSWELYGEGYKTNPNQKKDNTYSLSSEWSKNGVSLIDNANIIIAESATPTSATGTTIVISGLKLTKQFFDTSRKISKHKTSITLENCVYERKYLTGSTREFDFQNANNINQDTTVTNIDVFLMKNIHYINTNYSTGHRLMQESCAPTFSIDGFVCLKNSPAIGYPKAKACSKTVTHTLTNCYFADINESSTDYTMLVSFEGNSTNISENDRSNYTTNLNITNNTFVDCNKEATNTANNTQTNIIEIYPAAFDKITVANNTAISTKDLDYAFLRFASKTGLVNSGDYSDHITFTGNKLIGLLAGQPVNSQTNLDLSGNYFADYTSNYKNGSFDIPADTDSDYMLDYAMTTKVSDFAFELNLENFEKNDELAIAYGAAAEGEFTPSVTANNSITYAIYSDKNCTEKLTKINIVSGNASIIYVKLTKNNVSRVYTVYISGVKNIEDAKNAVVDPESIDGISSPVIWYPSLYGTPHGIITYEYYNGICYGFTVGNTVAGSENEILSDTTNLLIPDSYNEITLTLRKTVKVFAKNANVTLKEKAVKKIICVGDSITEGDQDGKGNADHTKAYPAYMQSLIGNEYVVENHGSCGAGVTTYITSSSHKDHYQASIDSNPDVVIISIGTNDMTSTVWNNINLANKFIDLIEDYKSLDSKPEIFIALSLDRGDKLAQAERVSGILIDVQKYVAKLMGANVIDTYTYMKPYTRNTTYFLADKLHPNSEGYKLMGQFIGNEFLKYVTGNTNQNSEITANWIWSSGMPETLPEDGNVWTNFRKEFTLDVVPDTAKAKIAAESRYWLYVNGELVVFEGGLKRGYNKNDGYYDVVELAPYLKEGKNTIAVAVWYYGSGKSFSSASCDAAGFLFEAQIGDKLIVSDNSWKAIKDDAYLESKDYETEQPNYRLIESNIYYDGSKSLGNWQSENYDDSAWSNAVFRKEYGVPPYNKLYERPIPLLKFSDIKEYENSEVYAKYKDTYTAEKTVLEMVLPYNAQVTPYLEIETASGVGVIDMRPDTYKKQEHIKGAYLTTSGKQSFESLSWFSAEKVIYTIPAGVKIIKLGYRESGYNTEFAGSFTSDDEFMNSLWEKSLRTLYITMRDNYMDCPDRERTQWWGDVTLEMMMGFYSLDQRSYDLYEKGIYTKLGYIEDDILYTVVPQTNYLCELPMQELAGIGGVWEYYMYTGNNKLVADFYDAGKNYLKKWTIEDSGLVAHRSDVPSSWMDWMDWGSNADVAAIENAWYHIACSSMQKMAELLGKTDDVAYYQNIKTGIEKGYELFWTENGYKADTNLVNPDDRANALAVLSGIATKDKYEIITNVLTTVKNASPYMEKYVLDALIKMDETDKAITRIKERYAPMITGQDANSTLWEFWDKTSGTSNHAWTGGPLITMSRDLAGIKPTSPAYKTYEIKPDLSVLDSIDVTVPAIIGDIKETITKTDDSITMNVVLPADNALIALPRIKGAVTKVTVNNVALFDGSETKNTVSGVVYTKNDSDYIYFNADAGTYKFVVTTSAQEKDEYTLAINGAENGSIVAKIGNETVTAPFTKTVAKGTQVTVTANANDGYTFKSFTGSIGSNLNEISFVMNSDISLTGEFEEKIINTYEKVTVNIPDNSDITVTIDGKTITNGESFDIKTGNKVSLSAKDGEKYAFVYWSGDVYSKYKDFTFTVTEDTNITVMGAYKGTNNLALGKSATTNSDLGKYGFSINLLTDGDTTSSYGYSSTAYSSKTLTTPVYVNVDLGSVQTFDTITLYPRITATSTTGGVANYPDEFYIQVSDNGTTFTNVKHITNASEPTKEAQVYDLGKAITGRYVRINCLKTGNPGADEKSNHRIQINELEVSRTLASNDYTLSIAKNTSSTTDGYVLINGQKKELPASVNFSKGSFVEIQAIAKDGKVSSINGDFSTNSSIAYAVMNNNISLNITFASGSVSSVKSGNYAKGGAVSAYNQYQGGTWNNSYLTDGSYGDSKSDGYTSGTFNPSTYAGEHWVQVDLGSVKQFDELVLYARKTANAYGYTGYCPNYMQKFKVLVSSDGKSFTEVGTFTEPELIAHADHKRTYDLGKTVTGRYIRINTITLGIRPPDEARPRIQIAELEVYNNNPNYALGAAIDGNNKYTTTNAGWIIANLVDGINQSSSSKGGFTTNIYYNSTYPDGDISSNPQTITIDLGKNTDINQVAIYGRNDTDGNVKGSGLCPNFPENFTISIKAEGDSDYKVVKTVTGEKNILRTNNKRAYDLDKTETARYIKITTTKLGIPAYDENTGVNSTARRVQIAEIEVYLTNRNYVSPSLQVEMENDMKLGNEYSINTTFTDGSIATKKLQVIKNNDGTLSDIGEIVCDKIITKKTGSANVYTFSDNGQIENIVNQFKITRKDWQVEGNTLTIYQDLGNFTAKTTPWYENAAEITKVVVAEGVTALGDWALSYLKNVEEVTLPSTLKVIGKNAFYRNEKLTEITIPEGVTEIENGAFAYCYNLKTINLPKSIKTIGKLAFIDCKSLETVNFAGTLEMWSNVTIGTGNEAIKDIYPPSTEEKVFEWNVTDGVLTISGNVEMEDYASKAAPWFDKADEITKVVIEDGIKSIGANAFAYLRNLEEVEIADTVTSIGGYAFYGCTLLKEADIPDNVTYLGSGAFAYCKSLKKVTVPAGVKTLYKYTFIDNYVLKTAIYEGDFNSLKVLIGNDDFVDAYKAE